MSHAITHASAIPNVPAGSGQILPAPLGALLRGPALAGYAVIGGFALVMAAWAILAPLSSSAIATGVVSPDFARRTVQHLEGGIVSRILVKDGDHVSAGQVLIEMDSTGAGAVNEALQNQIFEAEAAEARLEAEISGAETLIFPAVLQETAAHRDAAAKALAVQQNIFDVRRQAELKKRAILRSRIAQIEEQIAGLRTERVALNRQAALVADRVTALQTLLTKGLVAKSSVIELQSHAAGLEGAIGQNAAAIAGAEQASVSGRRLPLWDFARRYSLADRFFAAAFGGSFLNHLWLACACTPRQVNPPKAHTVELNAQGELIKDGAFTPDGYADVRG